MFCVLLILQGIVFVTGFPDGAPSDTCVKARANQPNHGASRSQDLHTLPYEVRATTDTYNPGQQVQVTVEGSDLFRGFFLQARDADTNEWIGTFKESPNTKLIPECSAITHADPKDKQAAVFLWNAPQHKKGRVYFTGTVVKDYGTYWADIIAKIPATE
ncbi:putative defense protein 3 [Pseudolycoriella hygida]|uniref:Defense protein 3 n=1 Tax=Pseudolycoriella hygida TaxID=35572 RepID=A0A9Q0MU53_9DIPT|nr:putative defense protein 3 [Pseudolycoriella hygida]